MTDRHSAVGAGWAIIAPVMFTFVIAPAIAGAQTYPRARSFEVGSNATWIGGSTLGATTAAETRNQTSAGDPLTLFETDGRLNAVAGIDARVAFNFTSTVGIEAALTYSRPSVVIRVSNDFEGAPDTTMANSTLAQYFADVGVILHLTSLRAGSRTVPFVAASAGYLRQLTANPAVAETGRVYQVGGGLKHSLTTGGGIGLRFEVRLGLRDRGFALAEPIRRQFLIARAGAFATF